jgi:hypothetical protein
MIYPKRKHCLYRRPVDEISRTLHLMLDGISFDKILPKQVGYFGTRINWKQPLKIENSTGFLNWGSDSHNMDSTPSVYQPWFAQTLRDGSTFWPPD